jgi:hypothetical protein
MTRLIDADPLLKELRKSCEYHAENSREFSLLQRDIIIVQEQPTIDAVPVIRCKDCKYNPKTSYTGCPMASISGRTETDYCSRAERKPPQVNPEMVKALRDRIEKQRGEHDTAD